MGGVTIGRAQLDALAKDQLVRIRPEEYDIERRVLDQRVEQLLLEQEAADRKLSLDALLAQEVDKRVSLATEEERRALYEAAKDRFPGISEAQALDQIGDGLKRQRAARRRAEFLAELRAKRGVRILLEAPRVAVDAEGPSRGGKKAPVTIVEFSEQGHFWEMHDKLFANQKSLQVTDLKRYAGEIGLEQAAFDQCLDSGKEAARLQKNKEAGARSGVTGTPSFFVNGRPVTGNQPIEAFTTVIDEELERATAQAPATDAPRPAAGSAAPLRLKVYKK